MKKVIVTIEIAPELVFRAEAESLAELMRMVDGVVRAQHRALTESPVKLNDDLEVAILSAVAVWKGEQNSVQSMVLRYKLQRVPEK